MDLAPTILYLFDLPIPADMDGKVLKDVFDAEYFEKHPIRFTAEGPKDEQRGTHQYSEEEADAIRKRLQGLGYL
jgi:arylsulfatase A-like enzyme